VLLKIDYCYIYVNVTMSLIWDNLPDCIQYKIYSYIIYNQPANLLDDIKSYVLVI